MVQKSIVDEKISSFQIDVSHCFKTTMSTHDSNEIIVEAAIDGEYKNDLLLNVIEEGTTIKVSAGFQANFENPNDKLSAHKVISIALNIKVPEHKAVNIFGTHCNINTTGRYKNLKLTLNDGDTHLEAIEGVIEVTSQSGHITLQTKAATIFENSKFGKVSKDQIPMGDTRCTLKTITGNIYLKRIE